MPGEKSVNRSQMTTTAQDSDRSQQPADDSVSDTAKTDSTVGRTKQPSCCWKTMKYTLFALAVFMGQIAISVTLKRYGVIEKDLNEIVAERVHPHIEKTIMSMSQFNDSMYWVRNFNDTLNRNTAPQQFRPGYQLAQKGAKAHYPIIMIPGFVTSALELWEGRECAKNSFRQRIWGGLGMIQHFLSDRLCAVEHLKLDPLTGMDPEGVRIRAGIGFEAADYFAGNYWVWSKLLENLADLGYDGNLMEMVTYDWRIAYPLLEERDGYMTKLKYRIEAMVKFTGKKVVMTSHSMGCSVVHYFFQWVTTSEREGGGGGGKDWVDTHVHAYINIAGAQLGAAKTASSLLSGEMSDTAFAGTLGDLVEQILGRKTRKDLWMSWGALWTLLPKGGAGIWDIGADLSNYTADGNYSTPMVILTDSEDVLDEDEIENDEDSQDCKVYEDPIIQEAIDAFSARGNQTVDDINTYLRQWGGGAGPQLSSAKLNSFDVKDKPSRSTWQDMSRTPLPHAPKLKIYCLYGYGLDTERGYYYKRQKVSEDVNENRTRLDPPFILDTSVEDPENNVHHGVRYGEGDGSVPLLSLGYLCADGWRRKETGLNPSKLKVISREYRHKSEFQLDDPTRGGPYSAEHVDIMGNLGMMTDFLKVVADFEVDSVGDNITSSILEIAEKIAKHPKGGLAFTKR